MLYLHPTQHSHRHNGVNRIALQKLQIPLIRQCSKAQAKHSKYLGRLSARWPSSAPLTSWALCMRCYLSETKVFINRKSPDEPFQRSEKSRPLPNLYFLLWCSLWSSADSLTCLSQVTLHLGKQSKSSQCVPLPIPSEDKWMSRRRNV